MAKGGAKINIGNFNTFFMDVLEISSYWHNNRLEANYSAMELLPVVLADLLELKELITASRSKSKNSLPMNFGRGYYDNRSRIHTNAFLASKLSRKNSLSKLRY